MSESTNDIGPVGEDVRKVQLVMNQCAAQLATLNRPSDALWVIDRLKDGVLAMIALAVLKTKDLKGANDDVPTDEN